MPRVAPCVLSLIISLAPPTALAGPNQDTTLPLHAVETTFGPCDIPDPCDPGPLVTQVSIGSVFTAYLLAWNYDNIAGVQTAFDWPSSLYFLFSIWDCQANQVSLRYPTGPGSTDGTITTAFDCITGGETAVIGRVHMQAHDYGCLHQLRSDFPNGSHVVSGTGEIDRIRFEEYWLGSVCAGSPGYDACIGGCPPLRAVCCRHDGSCDGDWCHCEDGYVMVQEDCTNCNPHGACCRADGSCFQTRSRTCSEEGGEFFEHDLCEYTDCVDPIDQTTWGHIKALHRK